MGRTASDYLKLLQSLLPLGKVWNRSPSSVLTEVLNAEADEFARIETRSDEIIVERDTRLTNEFLTDYEREFNLPDECTEENATVVQRRREVHLRYIAKGRQDKQYFIDLALALGWIITITEYTPAICGVAQSGDPCGPRENAFYWTVNVQSGGNEVQAQCGSAQSGDSINFLAGADSLICVLFRYKPAHTLVDFIFFGPAYDRGFSSGYDSIPSDITQNLEGAYSKGYSDGYEVAHGGGFSDGYSIGYEKQF